MRVAHRFIVGKRASNSVSPVGTAKREERAIRPLPDYGDPPLSLFPALKMLGLLSEIPPGPGCDLIGV